MKPARIAAVLAAVAVLGCLGGKVVETTRVDRLAETDPEAALRLDPDHPHALLVRARRQLASGDDAGALATARHLLAVSPGQGDAFAIIALAADRTRAPNAGRLLEIAAQRAPRITQVRARLAAVRLQAGDVPGALAQLDALLRVEPEQGDRFFPALAAQLADLRFAGPMAETLARNPPWRRRFLDVLNAKGPPAGIDNLYAQLQSRGSLSEAEVQRWLDGMISKGRWGDAFAAWFGTLKPVPERIPAVRNGGFEDEIDGVGFGWRNSAAPGAFTDIEAGAGPDGSHAAHVHFIGRPMAKANLRQPLLLAPGRYRLSLKARADGIVSERGLLWGVRCDHGDWIANTKPLDGSFEWTAWTADFEVPAQKCEGQWLELHNPAVSGSAQQVEGDLWLDDVAITPAGAD